MVKIYAEEDSLLTLPLSLSQHLCRSFSTLIATRGSLGKSRICLPPPSLSANLSGVTPSLSPLRSFCAHCSDSSLFYGERNHERKSAASLLLLLLSPFRPIILPRERGGEQYLSSPSSLSPAPGKATPQIWSRRYDSRYFCVCRIVV